jgi:hypothetical protein
VKAQRRPCGESALPEHSGSHVQTSQLRTTRCAARAPLASASTKPEQCLVRLPRAQRLLLSASQRVVSRASPFAHPRRPPARARTTALILAQPTVRASASARLSACPLWGAAGVPADLRFVPDARLQRGRVARSSLARRGIAFPESDRRYLAAGARRLALEFANSEQPWRRMRRQTRAAHGADAAYASPRSWTPPGQPCNRRRASLLLRGARAWPIGLQGPTPRSQRASLAARCREGGAALAMLVPEAEQDRPPRSPPAGASHDTLLDHAYTGHAGTVAASLQVRSRRCGRRVAAQPLAAGVKPVSAERLGLARSGGRTGPWTKRRDARLWRIRGLCPPGARHLHCSRGGN